MARKRERDAADADAGKKKVSTKTCGGCSKSLGNKADHPSQRKLQCSVCRKWFNNRCAQIHDRFFDTNIDPDRDDNDDGEYEWECSPCSGNV